MQRYELTLRLNGLNDYEKNSIQSVFASKSAKDALYRADEFLNKYRSKEVRLTYRTKDFLEALAISAMTDLG